MTLGLLLMTVISLLILLSAQIEIEKNKLTLGDYLFDRGFVVWMWNWLKINFIITNIIFILQTQCVQEILTFKVF